MKFKNAILSVVLGISLVLVSSCADKDPSVLKVFVRSNANVLMPDINVRIVSDVNKNEGTPEYKDEVRTNESGVAMFVLDELFDEYGKKDDKIAHFTVYVYDTTEFPKLGTAKAKQYLTTTETIKLDN